MNRIHTVPVGKSNVYIVESNSSSLLVDAGLPNRESRILDAVDATAGGRSRLRGVIVTHTHSDHVGALKAVVDATDAPVFVHQAEAANLAAGRTPLPAGTSLFPKLMMSLASLVASGVEQYDAVTPATTVGEELDLSPNGIDGRLLYTPGHSAGSITLVLGTGEALVGDTMFHFLPRSVYPPFADRPELLRNSWKTLLDAGCHTFYPGHGRPIARELAVRAYEKLR